MSRADITETCGCGATLHVQSEMFSYAQEEAREWRANHRHELAPQPATEPEQHDTVLDAYVERTDHRDANPAAEMDRRTDRTIPGSNPIGFHP